jgi:hypothetical protein
MLPLYNQELWVSMKAGITASTGATPSTYSAHYANWSTGAFPVEGSTSGVTLTYLAYDPPTNKIYIMYSEAS